MKVEEIEKIVFVEIRDTGPRPTSPVFVRKPIKLVFDQEGPHLF